MAIRIERNTILYTRDGRKIGNALVYGYAHTAKGITYWLVTDDDLIYNYRYEQLEGRFFMFHTKPADKEHRHYNFTGII